MKARKHGIHRTDLIFIFRVFCVSVLKTYDALYRRDLLASQQVKTAGGFDDGADLAKFEL
jgi:hypothetical protein